MRPQGSDRAGLGGPSLRPEARQPYLQKLGLGGAWGGRSGGPAGSARALALSLWHPCWVPSGSQPGQEAPQGGSWIRSLGFLPRASSFIPGGARARGAGCRTVLVLQGQHSFVGGGRGRGSACVCGLPHCRRCLSLPAHGVRVGPVCGCVATSRGRRGSAKRFHSLSPASPRPMGFRLNPAEPGFLCRMILLSK